MRRVDTGMRVSISKQMALRSLWSSSRLLRHPKAPASTGTSISGTPLRQDDIQHAVHMVQTHDPAGDFPGRLMPTNDMKLAYYGVRSFWVETGLRFGSTARVASPRDASPLDHLEWWKAGIGRVYDMSNTEENLPPDWDHPTLRLLQHLTRRLNLSKSHFDDILLDRRKDLEVKQYATLDSLVDHVTLSCGSLNSLVLESGGLTSSERPHEASRLVGICHGLTNALRTSIPIISTTGKLIVPEDLCVKYGVRSPRYLLTALGLGDEQCRQALQYAIRDIAGEARKNLQQARDMRDDLASSLSKEEFDRVVATLLPGLASETFLTRLEQAEYNLTDRNLRHVGAVEHALCAARMLMAYAQKRY